MVSKGTKNLKIRFFIFVLQEIGKNHVAYCWGERGDEKSAVVYMGEGESKVAIIGLRNL